MSQTLPPLRIVREKVCPQCGEPLNAIRYPGGYLNRDQWEASVAGEYWCSSCPPNGRSFTNSYCYFWEHELPIAPDYQI